jgi:hypothetical protein
VPGSSPISGEAEEPNAADISRTSSLHPSTRSHGQVRSPTSDTAIVVVPTASQTDEQAATWEELGLGNIMGMLSFAFQYHFDMISFSDGVESHTYICLLSQPQVTAFLITV